MAAHFITVCALALFAKSAVSQFINSGPYVPANAQYINAGPYVSGTSQYVNSGSYVSGNSIVDNNIIINSGLNNGYGFGYGYDALPSVGVAGPIYGGSIGVSAPNVVLGGLSGLNIGTSGPLIVTSISPIGPSGLAIASEIVLEGVLTVSGQLPFLSAVAFEGAVPSAGSGVATCGCGSGEVAIISEGFPTAPAVGLGSVPVGYGTIGTGIGGIYY